MKKVIIAMLCMLIFLVLGASPISMIFRKLIGGGIAQSYIYPIYGAIVVLTGIIVGSTTIIIKEIRELKEFIKQNIFDKKG